MSDEKIPPNHVLIQSIGTIDDDGQPTNIENLSFSSESGEWTLRMLLSAAIQFFDVAHLAQTGGLRISDVPEESRIIAIREARTFLDRTIQAAEDTLREETLNPDGAARQVRMASDEGTLGSEDRAPDEPFFDEEAGTYDD